MKWNIKKSLGLKSKIAQDPELMGKLARCVEEVFSEFKINLPGMSYVFEPRVFSLDPEEAPEIMNRSRAAMLAELLDDLVVQRPGNNMEAVLDMARYRACLPQCGPMDPFSLKILEKLRIRDIVNDDPVPIIDSAQLMRRITGNKNLLKTLSASLFQVLQDAGIKFSQREGCVFTPVVFQSPVYAQKVGVAADIAELEGFGPQLYASADPTPEPASVRIKPFPGIIEFRGRVMVPGVIIDRWWWIGIPAPEMLMALDRLREYR